MNDTKESIKGKIRIGYQDDKNYQSHYIDIEIGDYSLGIDEPITSIWEKLLTLGPGDEFGGFSHNETFYSFHSNRLHVGAYNRTLGDMTCIGVKMTSDVSRIFLVELEHLTKTSSKKEKYTPITEGIVCEYFFIDKDDE